MLKIILAAAAALAAASSPAAVTVSVAGGAPSLTRLPVHVAGRAERSGEGWVRQWPGSYFETAFRGTSAYFRVGPGDVILKVVVDGREVETLVKPSPGLFRVAGLTAGRHRLRVEVASESQAGPTIFGGFSAPRGTVAAPLRPRSHQIEFIGDSHTVGYGNASPKKECTQAEVWATTDATKGFGPEIARRYDADYQINAISGRGVVRNYNGFVAPSLPDAYRFTLFDRQRRDDQPDWHPQVVVIALGTNDFTTPLHAGEKWATREALHEDFEATYVGLVRQLRARNPRAFFVLWATDMADGEIEAEVARVADKLRSGGETRLAYVPIDRLSFSACNSHPSQADDRVIADRIDAVLRSRRGLWDR